MQLPHAPAMFSCATSAGLLAHQPVPVLPRLRHTGELRQRTLQRRGAQLQHRLAFLVEFWCAEIVCRLRDMVKLMLDRGAELSIRTL